MLKSARPRIVVAVAALTAIACALALAVAAIASRSRPEATASPAVITLDDGQQLLNVWSRANAATSYRFNARIEQMLDPRAGANTIGRQTQHLNLGMEGDVQRHGLDGPRARVTLWIEGQSAAAPPVTLVQQNGKTYIQKGDVLEPAKDDFGSVAPAMPENFLDYLRAAENVRAVALPLEDGGAAEDIGIKPPDYTFDINIEKLFAAMAERVTASGGLRPAMPPSFAGMTARGELWVSDDGLPRRQVIYMTLPGASEEYDARVRMTLDLSHFGGVPPLPELKANGGGTFRFDAPVPPPPGSAGVWRVPALMLSTNDAQALHIALLALGGALLFLAWYRRNRKAGYAAVAVTLTGIFALSQPLSAVEAAMRRAADAGKRSVASALGLVAPAAAPLPAPASALALNTPSNLTTPNNGLPKCGDGAPGVDTDQDGLTDQQENCLGTDPTLADSDSDGATDWQEITGFTCGGKTWTTNPIDVDTNRDGKADGFQYPSTLVNLGDNEGCDVDGDGVPNVWDSDNDNDGVSNATDLSQYATTSGYTNTFGLQIDPQGYTGTVYVELQVQPQNPEHLRYSLTPLDWPNGDNEGAIRDLDNSTDDIRLVPMLEVETTISPTLLARQYGFTVRAETNPTRTLIYAPLQPQSDGGLFRNFYAKVAYAPGELTAPVKWKARMLWFVQAKVDAYTASCLPNNPGVAATGMCTVSRNEIVHIYKNEPFRISGMNVVKSDRFETAVFGTPQSSLATEDKYLFQTVIGLNASFMDYKTLEGQAANSSALQEFARRFNTPGTPLGLRFQVPETVTVAVSNTVYSHLDEGTAGTVSVINTFLNQKYLPLGNQCSSGNDANGNPIRFLCATIGIASEQRIGSRDLRELTPNADGEYAVGLGSIPMLTKRNLKTVTYERTTGTTWKVMPLSRTLNMIRLRYAGIMEARLAELRQTDPELTQEMLLSGQFLLYAAWSTGADRSIEFDAQSLVSIDPESDEATITLASVNFVAKVRDLAEFGVTVKQLTETAQSRTPPSGKIGTAVTRVGAIFEAPLTVKIRKFETKIPSFGAKVLGGVQGALLVANLAVSIANLTCTTRGDKDCQERLKVADTAIGSLSLVANVVGTMAAFGGLEARSGGFLKAIKGNLAEATGKASAAFAVIGTVITIGLAWTQFGLAAASGLSAPAFKLALATAIFATIWALITLAISFIPFGIGGLINAILSLIDQIISLATGGSLSLLGALLKLFYDVKLATQINGPQFVDQGTGWSNPDAGMVAGNVFKTSSIFSATITLTGDGGSDDLRDNYARGYVITDTSGAPGAVIGNAVNAPANCIRIGNQLNCANAVSAEFKLLQPGMNTRLAFTNFFDFKYTYFECGLFCAYRYSTSRDQTTQPAGADVAKARNEIVVDVLPATMDALWNWSAPGLTTNADRDGDGLSNSDEAKLGTSPTNPDSDGDGLSDGYEVNTQLTDPLRADTDSDGLRDGLEVQFGADPKRPDSDGDGLSDGAEVFHDAGGNNWTGGWNVTLPGGLAARIFPDPRSADADGDGLTDGMERANGSSPDAFHVAPLLRLDSQPLTVEPGGAAPTAYVAPGGAVAFTIYLATGPTPIGGTLSVCLPGSVINKTVGTLYGNRTFAPVVSPNACGAGNADTRYEWAFGGGNTLQIGEFFSTTVTGNADPSATVSVRTAATANVTAGSTVLDDTTTFVLDADQPGTNGINNTGNLAVALAGLATEQPDGLTTDQSVNPATAQRVNATPPLPGISFSAPEPGAILRRDPAGTTFVVGGLSNDSTSWIARVDLDTGAGAGFVTAEGTSPWSYAWQLPADGNYTLQARSYDYVGNLSAVTTTQVIVDGTPPTVTLSVPGNLFVRPSPTGTILLTGAASDNLAGLSFIQISINNAPWTILQNVPAASQVLNANWSYLWTLPQTAEASGAYLIRVRATDRAGNESDIPSFRLVVDGLPPTDDLSTNIYLNTPDVRAGQPLALSGRATDLGNVPLPSRPAALAGTLDSVLGATTWLQYRSVTDDDGGVFIHWLGDINGDARADLAVGTPGSDGGAGRVSIIAGRGGNWPVPPNAEAIFDSKTSFVGAPGAGIGNLVAPAGDVNGDGFFDILIGDAANRRAFVVFGRGAPLGANLPLTGSTESGAWSTFDALSLGAVTGVASAGDVNGDGFADVLIGAGGAAYLVLGHTGAWYSSANLADEAAAVLPLPAGATATGVGNVNGDAFADFVVTAPNAVYLVLGSGQFAARARQSLAFPTNAVAAFGSSDASVRVTALGDVNGDALSDFAFSSGSAPQVVLGRSSGGWGVSLSLGGYSPAPDGFIAAPGDVDADGINDIVLGVASNNSAYLILGRAGLSGTPNVQATFTGVAAVASAPYSVGADLNCDLSSDLLMLPTQALPAQTNPFLGVNTTFASKSFVSPQNLPAAPGVIAATATAPGVRYVDNDYCATCANDGRTYLTNAFDSIAQALVNAPAGTQIVVQPGVYGPFAVTQANITITGMDADAVFVDGGGGQSAISINNTFNTRLSNLTVRNAARLISLTNAGRNYGDGATGQGTSLDHLVLHSFTGNAIWMDNASTVDVSRTTIVGDSASGPHVFVDRSAPDEYFPTPTWTTRGNLPANATTGSQIAATRNGSVLDLFAMLPTTPLTFQRYDSATNTWAARPLPAGVTTVRGMTGGGVFIKAVLGDGVSNNLAYLYNPNTNLWSPCPSAPFTPGVGFAMSEGNANQAAYVLAGGGASFYLFNCVSGGWQARAPMPVAPGAGAAMVTHRATGDVYVLAGGNSNAFYRYNAASNTWTALPNAPFNANDGTGLAYSNGIWAVVPTGPSAGGNTVAMGYFNDAQNRWVALPFSAPPGAIGAGGGVAALGSALSGSTLFVLRGGVTNQVFSYGPAGSANGIPPNSYYPPVKARFTATAFVGAQAAANTAWLNTSGTQFDFDYALDGASQFVSGGTFSPAVPAPQVTSFAAARFLDPARRVYRVEPGTALTAGHYTARPDAYVSPLYCATCANDGRIWGVTAFDSIQAAINSGAPRVILLAGVYPEPFYLTNGVQVVGAGAESTIIQPRPGITRFCPGVCPVGQNLDAVPIVTADGIQSALLARVTIAGYGFDGALTGLRASNGATFRFTRNIVRDSANGLLLSGSTTQVEISNNTLVDNSNGIMAIQNAPIDVRNTHFGNRFAGMWYFTAAPSVIRQYNNYFGQPYPILLNAGATPIAPDGLGEITIDPLFSNAAGDDYRPLPSSPLIDAGNPSDPTPPGAGRTDIGYTESGAASFYVSGAYGPLAANDGLIWGVDAFDRIQPALSAAGSFLRSIGCANPRNTDPFAAPANTGLCDARVQVGVAAGTYNENVVVPSYVSLRGVSADAVTINGGSGAYVVNFSGAVHAELSGVRLTGAIGSAGGVLVSNASNAITITRVVISIGGVNGVQFTSGSSGHVRFNTIFNSSVGIEATGANSWVDARNNILSGLGGTALGATNGGQLFSRYNLLNTITNYAGVAPGPGDIVGQNPQFAGFGDFTLQVTSPARDAAEPYLPESAVPVGGGKRADLGYKEVVATPVTLLFGRIGPSPCFIGNSGVASVEIGVAPVSDYTLPVTATLPTTWTPATLQTPGATASFWSASVTPAGGLARLYTRAADALGNLETTDFDYSKRVFPLYSGAFVGDETAPVVTLVTPAGVVNTTAAAIELVGTASDYNGARFSVAAPYFEAISGGVATRIAADWVQGGWNNSGPRTFRAVAVLPPGAYSVTARAQDEAGNIGASSAVAVTLNAPASPNHVVAFTDIGNNGWTNQATLRLVGSAVFANVNGSGQVTMQVGAGPVVTATLDNPLSLLSTWSADVALATGDNTVTARAGNGSGVGPATTIIVRRDVTAPSLVAPASGSYYTSTVLMSGTATDAESGIESVEVSVDGGYRWLPATLSGANWSLAWTPGIGNFNVSFPAQVRARDRAGNVTMQSVIFTVDDIPPDNFAQVGFNIPPGTRLTSAQSLVMTWTTPLDNSGVVTAFASIDQISTTVPSAVAVNSLSVPMNLDGQWFAHLSAVDRAGNRVTRNFGPWYVNTGAFCSNPNVPIVLDGVIDTAANEWPATTFLDDDERPTLSGSPVQRSPQALHAFWGSNAFYLGWRGGFWDVDGALFAYLSTGGGGTTQLISATNAGNVLPFAADVAVAITGKAQGQWYRFSGGAWQPQAGLAFAQGDGGDTEIRVPLAVQGLGAVRLLAFARSSTGDAWSVFPTTNPVASSVGNGGDWADAYAWPAICSVTAPNAGQPRGVTVLTSLTSPQSSVTPLAPNTAVQYVVALDNREQGAVAGAQLTLTASAGLAYQSAVGPDGFVCTSCAAGANQFVMSVPSLAANATSLVTVTGQLAADLSTIPVVTATLGAGASGVGLRGATLTHLTDGAPPTVTALLAEPPVVQPGLANFAGAASDGAGIGVQTVEVRPAGSATWQPATGTTAWNADVTVPGAPTFVLEVRATDRYGQSSAVQTLTYIVDTTPPIVTFDLPAAISGTIANISGSTADPAPAGATVRLVEVQLDDGATPAAWLTANGPYGPINGSQGWNLTWTTPDVDGATYVVRARAEDAAGNVTTSDGQTTFVDTRAPIVTVTTAILNIGDAVPSPVLAGTATDGGGVSQVLARVFAPDGSTYAESAALNGSDWTWTPQAALIAGVYQVRVEAIDRVGNVRGAGPFVITVSSAPVTPTPSPTPSPTPGDTPTPTDEAIRPRAYLPVVMR